MGIVPEPNSTEAHTDPTWQRLRDAALQLFAERGFGSTGIRDLAKAAGISTATLYHHMEAKEDLLKGIMIAGMHRVIGAADRALTEASSPTLQLAALTRAHVIIHGRHQLEAVVTDSEMSALSPESRAEVVRLRDQYEVIWTKVLQAGQASGEFRIAHHRLIRLAIIQMSTGVAYWYSQDGEFTLDEIADHFARLAVAMAVYGSTPVPVEGFLAGSTGCAPTDRAPS